MKRKTVIMYTGFFVEIRVSFWFLYALMMSSDPVLKISASHLSLRVSSYAKKHTIPLSRRGRRPLFLLKRMCRDDVLTVLLLLMMMLLLRIVVKQPYTFLVILMENTHNRPYRKVLYVQYRQASGGRSRGANLLTTTATSTDDTRVTHAYQYPSLSPSI